MSVTERQADLIRSSFAAVAANRDAAGRLFYQRLFETAPQIRGMFPDEIGAQAAKLTAALGVVVAHVRDWQTLSPVVEDLARRHVGYGVEAGHYSLVGQVLLTTLDEALGDDFTPETREAWATAYTAIADRMISAAYANAA